MFAQFGSIAMLSCKQPKKIAALYSAFLNSYTQSYLNRSFFGGLLTNVSAAVSAKTKKETRYRVSFFIVKLKITSLQDPSGVHTLLRRVRP